MLKTKDLAEKALVQRVAKEFKADEGTAANLYFVY